LCIGVVSLLLFFLVAALNPVIEYTAARTLPYPASGAAPQVKEVPSTSMRETLAAGTRVLIVPIYVVWMLISVVQVAVAGPHGLPQPLATLVWGFSMVAGLAPYALVDYILDRVRRTRSRN
jgi:uncharacterized membrane protein YgcG